MDLQHAYVVIMAGGSGTRLWPLSRKNKPKQFQALLSEKTMIQETFARIAQVLPIDNIFVSTTAQYQSLVREQLPEVSEDRVILEPEARNTGPAIAFVSAMIEIRDPDAVVATVASDHAIENTEEFTSSLQAALATVARYPEKLVQIGINPTHPDTGLGYIKMGEEVEAIGDKRVFVAEAFKEKPDRKTAEVYVSQWEYLWNASYFIFRARTFSEWTKRLAPELARVMEKIRTEKAQGTLTPENLKDYYAETPAEPIDTLLVEKLSPQERLVIPSAMRWSDVGNWAALYDFLQEKKGEHLISRGKHIDIGSENTLVYGNEKLIATVGLKDVVIVDMDDALLVARRDQVSTDIKKLIEKFKQEKDSPYL
jgi:mannose-1-phosphate guanylyltransferase